MALGFCSDRVLIFISCGLKAPGQHKADQAFEEWKNEKWLRLMKAAKAGAKPQVVAPPPAPVA